MPCGQGQNFTNAGGEIMRQKGSLTVISGFSGAGKGTIMRELLKKHPEYALSVSVTTRSPRPGEKDGVDYHFLTQQQFDQMVEEDGLLEHAGYVDHCYGTPRKYVEEAIAAGKDVILEIELQGALKIKKKFPEALLLFIVPPDAKTLLDRLRGRNTETEDVIQKRLARAAEESEGIEQYDYIIVNDDLEQSMELMHHLIESQHNKTDRNLAFIHQIQEEVREFVKGEK